MFVLSALMFDSYVVSHMAWIVSCESKYL